MFVCVSPNPSNSPIGCRFYPWDLGYTLVTVRAEIGRNQVYLVEDIVVSLFLSYKRTNLKV